MALNSTISEISFTIFETESFFLRKGQLGRYINSCFLAGRREFISLELNISVNVLENLYIISHYFIT